jgi:phosphate transport system substrate-binding protein
MFLRNNLMTKFISIVLFCSVMLLCSCNYSPTTGFGHKKKTVTLAGSTSIMPFTEKLAEHFMIDHPEFVINVQGGGSTAGIQACLNKTIEIGMSSRQLKQEETILNEILICYDGISVVVHPRNPVSALTLEQIRGIFSGRIRNWKELGWIDRKIDAVTREEGSGTRGSFEELVMKNEEIYDGIMVQDSNGSVKEVVATDPYAIGYISLGLVDNRVRALSINGIYASVENIKTKKYKIVRPFLFLTYGDINDNVKIFINFVISKDGQNILKKEGLIGIL